MKKILKVTFISVLVMLVAGLGACSSTTSNDKTVNIANKNYTEQRLLGEMMGIYAESLGYEVEVTELGGSMLVFESLKADTADVYAEYTGTAYGAHLGESETLSREDTYDFVKEAFEEEYGITWLETLGFNNTYVLAVNQTVADKYNIKTISDLAAVSGELILGSDSEFPSRDDGLPGLMEAYDGLEFKDVKSMDQGLLYYALENDEIQVLVAYATEGRLAQYKLINLEDDLAFFPPYDVAPVMKQTFADANPELVEGFNKLGGLFSDSDMQAYNLQVDEGGNVKDIARTMLVDKGLID
jgi:glycine betaine/choline ABC-type transport system substrate-binding protein